MSQLRLLSTSNPGVKEVDTPSCSCTPQTTTSKLAFNNDTNKNSQRSFRQEAEWTSSASPSHTAKLTPGGLGNGSSKAHHTNYVSGYKHSATAKYLSPSRSHVSQIVKPLFAGRPERQLVRHSNASSKTALNQSITKQSKESKKQATSQHQNNQQQEQSSKSQRDASCNQTKTISHKFNSFSDNTYDSDNYDNVSARISYNEGKHRRQENADSDNTGSSRLYDKQLNQQKNEANIRHSDTGRAGFTDEPVAQENFFSSKLAGKKNGKTSLASKTSRAMTMKNASSKSGLGRSKALENRDSTVSAASTTPQSKDSMGGAKANMMQVFGKKPGHKKNVSSIMSGLSESDHVAPSDCDKQEPQPSRLSLKQGQGRRDTINSVICQETAKIQAATQESMVLLHQNKGKVGPFNQTRNAAILSPVRMSKNYHLGVLQQQKRKPSVSSKESFGSSTVPSSSKHYYVTMQASARESKNSLNSNNTTQVGGGQQQQSSHHATKVTSSTISKTISSQQTKTHSNFSLRSVVEAQQIQLQLKMTKVTPSSGTVAAAYAANQVISKGAKTRATKAVACLPDQSVSSVSNKLTTKTFAQNKATLKKRRSQEDIYRHYFLNPAAADSQGDQMGVAKEEVPKHQPKKCQLAKGIRQMSKKCKSQTRIQMKKRSSGDEVESIRAAAACAQTDRILDQISDNLQIPEATLEDEGRVSINILADANNFASSRMRVNAPQRAPEGDTQVASATDNSTQGYYLNDHLTQVAELKTPLCLPLLQPLEQKSSRQESPKPDDSIQNRQSLTVMNQQRAQMQSNLTSWKTTTNDMKSAFDWQGIDSSQQQTSSHIMTNSVCTEDNLNTPALTPATNDDSLKPNNNSKANGAAGAKKCLMIAATAQPEIDYSQMVPYSDQDDKAAFKQRSEEYYTHAVSIGGSQQQMRVTQQQPFSMTREQSFAAQLQTSSETQSQKADQLTVFQQCVLQKRSSNVLHRRKRSVRTGSNRVRKSCPVSSAEKEYNTFQQQPPVVTLDLAMSSKNSEQRKLQQPLIKIDNIDESLIAATQQEPLETQNSDLISFADAESCQGGMVQMSCDQEERQKTLTPEIQLTQVKEDDISSLNEEESKLKLKCFNDQMLEKPHVMAHPVHGSDQIKEKQQSDSMMMQLQKIKRLNFDEILEQRELETSTKSPPKDGEDGQDDLVRQSMRSLAMQLYTMGGRQTTSPLNGSNTLQRIESYASKRMSLKSQKSQSRSYLRTSEANAMTPKDRNRPTLSAMNSAKSGLRRRGSPSNISTNIRRKNSQASDQKYSGFAKKRTQAQIKPRNTSIVSEDSCSVSKKIFSTAKLSNRNLKDDKSIGFAVLEKSYSQLLNNSMPTSYKQRIHQKLFQVGSPITPRKNTDLTVAQRDAGKQATAALLKRNRSSEKQCGSQVEDTTSQNNNRLKSPSQVRSLSNTNPAMYVLRSTKKLTEFREFAITPSQKEGGFGCLVNKQVFISPIKLKKLEKKHGVQLVGNNDQDLQEGAEEGKFEVTEEHQALLQNNDAMDEYMKNLCQKYF